MTEEDISSIVEQEGTVNVAWIFDVDGVITNPQEKRITEPEILDHIAQKLELGEPVALNTGRSLVWMIDRVINTLLEKIEDKKALDNFFAVGEKGGTWLTFNSDGSMQQHKDESISVPEPLQQKVRHIIETEYADSMFYDATKQTMISVEMKDRYDIEEYRKLQEALSKKLNELIAQENLNQQLKIDPTTIAVDVENKDVGKGFATQRILEWLNEKRIRPKQFIAVGDSRSDIEIAEALNAKQLPFKFVFVGNKNDIETTYPFPITCTGKKFGQGTIEYLNNH